MAVHFSSEPPDAFRFHGMDLVRTPPTGKVRGLITSPDPQGTFTHFWGGRTVPHDTDHCPACEAQRRKQWHVYVALWSSEAKHHFLFECTDFAAQPIIALWHRLGNLRGVYLTAERRSAKKNAKVLITLNELSVDKYALPQAPDIIKTLQLIWRKPVQEAESIENPRLDNERWAAFTGNGNGTEH